MGILCLAGKVHDETQKNPGQEGIKIIKRKT